MGREHCKKNSEACLRVAEQMSVMYNWACRETRALGFSHSASERLAQLLLEWSDKNEKDTTAKRVKLGFTLEEILQMIGTAREAVAQLFTDFKRHRDCAGQGLDATDPQPGGAESIVGPLPPGKSVSGMRQRRLSNASRNVALIKTIPGSKTSRL
jgi:hypothetical protein